MASCMVLGGCFEGSTIAKKIDDNLLISALFETALLVTGVCMFVIGNTYLASGVATQSVITITCAGAGLIAFDLIILSVVGALHYHEQASIFAEDP